MINLGMLTEIKDLRTIWPQEALYITPWLAKEENLALLADTVGLDITLEETESHVGNFNVDIYANETGTDSKKTGKSSDRQGKETRTGRARRLHYYHRFLQDRTPYCKNSCG